MTIQGYDISNMTLGLPNDTIEINLQGWTVTTTILCLYASWFEFANYVALRANEVYGTCLLTSIKVKQEEEVGELCLIVLTYDQRYSNQPTTATPPPQYGTNGDAVEVDIRKHPNFVTASGGGPWAQWWNTATQQFDPNYTAPGKTGPPAPMPAFLSGVTKYYVGSGTVWTKVYYDAQPSDSLPDGTIQDPGFGFGPSGCYLALTCDQQKENAFWYRLTHYKYSAVPWPTEIYTSPNTVPSGTLNVDGSITG